MGRRYTAPVVHETYSGDEQTGEYALKVTYDVQAAEPDVGIMSPWLELVDVEVVQTAGMHDLTAKAVRDSLLNDDAWFEGLHDELLEHASEEAEEAAERRAEMRRAG